MNFILHYEDDFHKDTTLININDDERKKTDSNIRIEFGLCHKDVFNDKKSLGPHAFLCVHKHRDTSPFMMMSTDVYATMMS